MGLGDALALASLLTLAVPVLYQLGYSLAALRAKCSLEPAKNCRVDVIIPVYSEPLEAVVRSVKSVAAWAEKVIVVWDGDLPAGAPEALGRAAQGKLTLIHRGKRMGKASALNEALRRSTADYVFVLDAGDVFKGDYRVLCSCCSVVTAWKPGNVSKGLREAIATALAHTFTTVYRGRCGLGKPVVFLGTGSSVNRWVAARLGGWKEDAILEDVEFGFRLSISTCKPCYTEDAITLVSIPPSYAALRLQQSRWIRGVGQLLSQGLWREGWQLLYLLQYPATVLWHPLLLLAAVAGVSGDTAVAYTGAILFLVGLSAYTYMVSFRTYSLEKALRLAGAATALWVTMTPVLLLALIQGILGSREWGPVTPRSPGAPGGVDLAPELVYGVVSVVIALLTPVPLSLLILAYPLALAYTLVRFSGELA